MLRIGDPRDGASPEHLVPPEQSGSGNNMDVDPEGSRNGQDARNSNDSFPDDSRNTQEHAGS